MMRLSDMAEIEFLWGLDDLLVKYRREATDLMTAATKKTDQATAAYMAGDDERQRHQDMQALVLRTQSRMCSEFAGDLQTVLREYLKNMEAEDTGRFAWLRKSQPVQPLTLTDDSGMIVYDDRPPLGRDEEDAISPV